MTKTAIPDKLYFKIGEVAKMADVPTHVLRYWESEFPGINPKRANSKQRLYRRQDVELILDIKTLLHEQGYTIAGARKFLESGQKPGQAGAVILPNTKVSETLQTIKQELKELQNLLTSKKEN
ncbi:MerR family transcriptional regulator [Desulfopila sp. IMCC35006]|uniref:MerR family transcriptional regulator n=1 Tax=Desulfopila sp. IMCC35006 TaxID=2569542 RepID=UPI0010ABECAA|nr:MerR family transcriptional regulator [Desulfopila sp. IMCC35006]TKB23649.1 MerR family transcriptional regulator [Desulfopila sp. IMCC35006]